MKTVEAQIHLVHCEIREENDDVILDADDKSCVILIAAGNHFHVVTHLEELHQLVCWKLQRILTATHMPTLNRI